MLSRSTLLSHAILQEVRDSKDQLDKIKDGVNRISDSLATTQEQAIQAMKDHLQDKLDIAKFQTRNALESPELISASSGDWIFENAKFKSWESEKSPQGNVLFLNGSPGAGRSSNHLILAGFLSLTLRYSPRENNSGGKSDSLS